MSTYKKGTNELNEDIFTIFSTQMLVYFEKHKIVEIVMKLLAEIVWVRPSNPAKWMGKNIKRIASDIYRAYRQNYYAAQKDLDIPQHIPIAFHFRIVIYGRSGSGRKTQAAALAKKYNLVYVDVDHLIHEHLKHDQASKNIQISKDIRDAMDKDDMTLKIASVARMLAYRMIQKDCLHQGYVVVNYPHRLNEFRVLMEKMWAAPNKIIYLQCPEAIALKRLCGLPQLGRPQDTVDYFREEMRFFNDDLRHIEDYLAQRYETIYVDASPSSEEVKRSILNQLAGKSYLLGFKE